MIKQERCFLRTCVERNREEPKTTYGLYFIFTTASNDLGQEEAPYFSLTCDEPRRLEANPLEE